jgi:hypothetical protein
LFFYHYFRHHNLIQSTMETSTQPSTFKIGAPLGVAFGIFTVALFALWDAQVPIAEAAKKGSSGGASTIVGWAVALGLVVFAHIQFKKKGDGFMSYGQGLVTAIWTGVIGGLVAAIALFVYLKFINPGYLEGIKDFALNEASKNSRSEEGTEMAEKIMGYVVSPGAMAFFKCLGVFFLHLIIGLIVSIFTKKESAPAPY